MQQRIKQLSIIMLILLFGTIAPLLSAQDEPSTPDADASIIGNLTTEQPAGAAVVSPDGNFIYALNTDDGSLSIYAVDTQRLSMSELDASPLDLSGIDYTPVDLAISPDGTTLYVANRGFIGRSLLSPVTLFTIDPATGLVDLTSRRQISIPSEGEGLSGVSITPDGNTLYVSNAGNNQLSMIDISLVNLPENAQVFFVAPARQQCTGVGPQLCYVITTEDGGTQLFYDQIEGFEYQWGIFYKIAVIPETIDNPPADASAIRYTLYSILEEEQVDAGTSFALEISNNSITRLDDNLYQLFADKTFTCAPFVNCALLDNIIGPDAEGTIKLSMLFPESPDSPIIVAGIDAGRDLLTIAPIRAECQEVTLAMCYIFLQPNSNFEYFYGNIEGFDFEWGYLYELLVAIETVENPPADGPDRLYTLESIISQEPVPQGTPFNLSLTGLALEKVEDNLYSFHGEQQFTCEAELDCSDIDTVIGENRLVFLNMRFPDDLTQPLIVTDYALGD